MAKTVNSLCADWIESHGRNRSKTKSAPGSRFLVHHDEQEQ
jgi:hypothetical protein